MPCTEATRHDLGACRRRPSSCAAAALAALPRQPGRRRSLASHTMATTSSRPPQATSSPGMDSPRPVLGIPSLPDGDAQVQIQPRPSKLPWGAGRPCLAVAVLQVCFGSDPFNKCIIFGFRKLSECVDSFDYVGSSSSRICSSSKQDLRQDDHFPGYHYYHCHASCLVSITVSLPTTCLSSLPKCHDKPLTPSHPSKPLFGYVTACSVLLIALLVAGAIVSM